jgi:hypothetical protein
MSKNLRRLQKLIKVLIVYPAVIMILIIFVNDTSVLTITLFLMFIVALLTYSSFMQVRDDLYDVIWLYNNRNKRDMNKQLKPAHLDEKDHICLHCDLHD